MRIKKAGILIIAAAITCTTPAVPAMAADTSESVQEINLIMRLILLYQIRTK